MLTLPAAFAAHVGGDVTSLTVCWSVTKHNGDVIRGTAHQEDLPITLGDHAGTYLSRAAIFSTDVQSTSDGSVSNLDVEGGFLVDATADDLRAEDIEAGLYDQAPSKLFLLNWQDPDGGQRILVEGTLGEWQRDSDGRYRSEVRGLVQALAQQIIGTYSDSCDVKRFGDARCKKDIVSLTRTGTVTAVTSRKRFQVQLDAGPDPLTPVYYNGARLSFTAGDNEDFVREVRVAAVDTGTNVAEILLWEESPADVAVDDTLGLEPACDRQYETCRLIHENLVNFRGYGIYAVGRDVLMRGVNELNTEPKQVLTLQQYQDLLAAVAAAAAALL